MKKKHYLTRQSQNALFCVEIECTVTIFCYTTVKEMPLFRDDVDTTH